MSLMNTKKQHLRITFQRKEQRTVLNLELEPAEIDASCTCFRETNSVAQHFKIGVDLCFEKNTTARSAPNTQARLNR